MKFEVLTTIPDGIIEFGAPLDTPQDFAQLWYWQLDEINNRLPHAAVALQQQVAETQKLARAWPENIPSYTDNSLELYKRLLSIELHKGVSAAEVVTLQRDGRLVTSYGKNLIVSDNPANDRADFYGAVTRQAVEKGMSSYAIGAHNSRASNLIAAGHAWLDRQAVNLCRIQIATYLIKHGENSVTPAALKDLSTLIMTDTLNSTVDAIDIQVMKLHQANDERIYVSLKTFSIIHLVWLRHGKHILPSLLQH